MILCECLVDRPIPYDMLGETIKCKKKLMDETDLQLSLIMRWQSNC